MKIAYLSDFFPFSGFNSKFNTELYLELEKKNEVIPFTYYFDESANRKLIHLKERSISIDSHNIDAKEIIDNSNPLSYRSATNKILQESPDVFLTKFTSVAQNYSMGNLVRKLKNEGVPAICIFDEDISKSNRFFSMLFFRFYISQFNTILVPSNDIAKYLEKYAGNSNIQIFDYPFFYNFGDETDKLNARRKLDIPELSKTIIYPVLFHQLPEYEIFEAVISKVPDDMRFIVIVENPDTFGEFEKRITKSGNAHKVRLEYYKLFNSEISLFFDVSDAALLIYKNSYDISLLSLCYNFNLPVISENHLAANNIIDKVEGGVITSKSNPDNVISQITAFFNTAASSNYNKNILNKKNTDQWKALSDEIINICRKILPI